MLQLVGIALVGGIITVYLKSINQELALMSLICTGIIIVVTAFAYLTETFDLLRRIAEIGNVDQTLLKIVLKIVGIGYVIEFAAGILEDFGVKSIADKLVFAGKIIILTVSVPIFYALINILVGLVS